jgi:sulfur carrier protein ThiS adenylyltransferase
MNILRQGLERYFSQAQLERIAGLTVGIAGAGGLGSNCAAMLTRSGFCNFVIADFDLVEPSNLNRQFYFATQVGHLKVEALAANLRLINPDLNLATYSCRIQRDNALEIFAACDIIIEAFDQPEDKRILCEAFYHTGKLLIAASGLAGWHQPDDIVISKIHDKFFIVGDQHSAVSPSSPPCAPKVNIAAAKQANIVLSAALE